MNGTITNCDVRLHQVDNTFNVNKKSVSLSIQRILLRDSQTKLPRVCKLNTDVIKLWYENSACVNYKTKMACCVNVCGGANRSGCCRAYIFRGPDTASKHRLHISTEP